MHVCGVLEDNVGAEQAAESLRTMAPMTEAQMSLIQRTVDDYRAVDDYGTSPEINGAIDDSYGGQAARPRNSFGSTTTPASTLPPRQSGTSMPRKQAPSSPGTTRKQPGAGAGAAVTAARQAVAAK